MRFININRHDRIVHLAMSVNAQLVNARNAGRRGDHDDAIGHVENALNALIDVLKHLQFNDSVPRANLNADTPLHLWLDIATFTRLEQMAENYNATTQQIIAELLTRGVLSGEKEDDGA